jgi:hypothetical protein
VFCIIYIISIYIIIEMILFTAKYGFVHCQQPSSWPSCFRLIIFGGNRQGLQVDRDKAVLFGDWGEARSEKA